jgi:hypothetical protein
MRDVVSEGEEMTHDLQPDHQQRKHYPCEVVISHK